MFLKRSHSLLEEYGKMPVKVDGYERTIHATFAMSYNMLTDEAKQLLWMLAFMHREGISADIFRRSIKEIKTDPEPFPSPTVAETAAQNRVKTFLGLFSDRNGDWNESAFLTTMTELVSLSLISYDRTTRLYTLHSLVHGWASTVIPDAGEGLVRTAFLLAMSVGGDNQVEDHVFRRAVVSHIDEILRRDPEINVNYAGLFTHAYLDSYNLGKAERLARQVVDTRKAKLGDDHIETLRSIRRLATIHLRQGRWEEAMPLQAQVVATMKRTLGDESDETLDSMSELSETYYRQGRWKESEELAADVLDTRKQVYGEDHSDTIRAMSLLALIYKSQSRLKEAAALQEQVLRGYQRLFGDEGFATLRAMSNLASTYHKRGQFEEAEKLQVRLLDVHQRLLGQNHPDTLSSMALLASTYQSQGRLKEAEELRVQVLNAQKQVLGEEHPETLSSMHNLALIYHDQGRLNEAEELFVQVVHADKRMLGEDHPNRLPSIECLAITYQRQGRDAEYESLQAEINRLKMKS